MQYEAIVWERALYEMRDRGWGRTRALFHQTGIRVRTEYSYFVLHFGLGMSVSGTKPTAIQWRLTRTVARFWASRLLMPVHIRLKSNSRMFVDSSH